jgi:hypothetical protein
LRFYGIAVKNSSPGQISFAHDDSGVPAVAEVRPIAHTALGDI